jgi:hypothetical protein
MPIHVARTGEGTPQDKLVIEVTNGDLKQFDLVRSKWRFKNIQAFLEFALAVFSTEGMEVTLNHEGEKTRISPADELVEETPASH